MPYKGAPVVHTFDHKEIDKLIKECDPTLRQYIKALKNVSDGWERLFYDAKKKINELSICSCGKPLSKGLCSICDNEE